MSMSPVTIHVKFKVVLPLKKAFLSSVNEVLDKERVFCYKKTSTLCFLVNLTYYGIKISLKLCIKLALNVKQFSLFLLHLKVANC